MQSITADFSPIIHCFHKIHAAFGGYPSSGDHPLGLEYWGPKIPRRGQCSNLKNELKIISSR